MSLLRVVASPLRRCTDLPLSTSPTSISLRVFDIPSRRNPPSFIGSSEIEDLNDTQLEHPPDESLETPIVLRVINQNTFSLDELSQEEEEAEEGHQPVTGYLANLNEPTYRKLLTSTHKRKRGFQESLGYSSLNTSIHDTKSNELRRKTLSSYHNFQPTLLRMERKQNAHFQNRLPPTKKLRSLIRNDPIQSVQVAGESMHVDRPKRIPHTARLSALRDHFLQITQFPDWTSEYQAILKRPLKDRAVELQRLCDQFLSTAKQFGKIIINERNQPYEKKTIKSLQGKGIAGGEKYRVANIFFKFAINHNNIYESDQHAMKVAGHELKGLTAFMSSGMNLGLNFPLLALVDYRGFRLVAASILPISERTIVYGSCDGGVTVHTEVFEMNLTMEKIAKELNLKGHFTGVGNEKKWIYGPCDMEGHRASDGKQYIVDTARVWPCEAPDRNIKGGFLFQLLRGEFVTRYPIPLNSDAFSMFGEHDSATHNREITEATQYLLDTVIPAFAAFLDQVDREGSLILTCKTLLEHLHRGGINIRHLGRVRMYAKSADVRRLILGEIVARSLKNVLKTEMRHVSPNDERKLRTVIVEFFNLIFGTGQGSNIYWMTKLKLDAMRQYAHSLTQLERMRDHDLRCQIDLGELFLRVQELSDISFLNVANPLKATLTDEDLGEIEPCASKFVVPLLRECSRESQRM